ncbi:MAG: glutamate racemase [Clostridiales bacterium]|nr:glutamate racemase [Clostridiales bacterium]
MINKIGIFDSGLGGLTVLNEVCKYNPGLNLVYFGDTARVPYGPRSIQTITRYAKQDVAFLLAQGVQAILVACGTVSATALPALRETFDVPILGVIETACAQAALATRTGHIAVLGTQATVASGAYNRALAEINQNLRVTGLACPLFVPLIENGFLSDDPITRLTCERYLAPLRDTDVDTVILGCTHYPFLAKAITETLPNVAFVNAGTALALALPKLLGEVEKQAQTQIEFYLSDEDSGFLPIANQFLDTVTVAGTRKAILDT